MKYLTLIISNIFIVLSAVNAQNNKKNITKVFTWEIPACEYKGTYDPKNIRPSNLKNTVVFINLTGSILLETSVAVFKPEDMDRLSMHKLDEEYMEKINKYKSMKVISSPYWEKLKDTIIKALEEEYKLKKSQLRLMLIHQYYKTVSFQVIA
ncbi:MAG: hypothetical protein IPJ81_05520 [Chitinophagaceae bacterium]|nr:hypothetical protein [Chitinophagaceae bacterium]